MGTTVTISASSDYNTAGKQFIRRITGRHPKFTFAGDFIGRRSGKRNDVSSATVDEEGLYQERDVTRKGATDSFALVWLDEGNLLKHYIDEDEALALARQIGEGPVDYAAIGRTMRIHLHERNLAEGEGKPGDELITIRGQIGALEAGQYPRDVVRAARRAEIERLLGQEAANHPPGSSERSALEAELAALDARRAEILAALERLA